MLYWFLPVSFFAVDKLEVQNSWYIGSESVRAIVYRKNLDELPFVRVWSFLMLLLSVAYGAAICKTRSCLSDLSMDPSIGLCFLMYAFASMFKNIVCSKFLDPRIV